jgi:hypothetical protein
MLCPLTSSHGQRESFIGGDTTAVSLPPASIRSGAIGLRTICFGLCRFLVAMILSSLPAHNAGRKTLTTPGPTNRGQAKRSVRDLRDVTAKAS